MVKQLQMYNPKGLFNQEKKLNQTEIKDFENCLNLISDVDDGVFISSLTMLNDSNKFTFKQIAYIIKTWPQLFFKKAV